MSIYEKDFTVSSCAWVWLFLFPLFMGVQRTSKQDTAIWKHRSGRVVDTVDTCQFDHLQNNSGNFHSMRSVIYEQLVEMDLCRLQKILTKFVQLPLMDMWLEEKIQQENGTKFSFLHNKRKWLIMNDLCKMFYTTPWKRPKKDYLQFCILLKR